MFYINMSWLQQSKYICATITKHIDFALPFIVCTHLFEFWLNCSFSPKSKQVSHPSRGASLSLSSAEVKIMNVVSGEQCDIYLYGHGNADKFWFECSNTSVTYRSHVTGSNLAHGSRVVPVGIKRNTWLFKLITKH